MCLANLLHDRRPIETLEQCRLRLLLAQHKISAATQECAATQDAVATAEGLLDAQEILGANESVLKLRLQIAALVILNLDQFAKRFELVTA